MTSTFIGLIASNPVPTKGNLNSSYITSILAIIIAVVALISPIFVAKINNRHQQKMKKDEYDFLIKSKEADNKSSRQKFQWETYYKFANEIYSNLLINVGTYLADPTNLDLYEKAISSIYQTYAYADDDLTRHLQTLINELYKHADDLDESAIAKKSIHQTLELCAVSINKLLSKYTQF